MRGRVPIRGAAAQSLHDKLHSWSCQISPSSIPKEALHWTFTKSRGPGGQNVNKVNSKAELRLNIAAMVKQPWIPPEVSPFLPKDCIVKSDEYRTQEENKQECLVRLVQKLREAARQAAPSITSDEQFTRVQQLKKAAHEHNRQRKEHRTSIKRDRGRVTFSKDDNY